MELAGKCKITNRAIFRFEPAMNGRKRVRFLVVDDHVLFCDLLTHFFSNSREFKLLGVAGSLSEAERILEREEVDVLLINLHLHGETPLPTISAWRKRFPSVRFLIMGATAKPSVVAETTKWGAIGFVSRRDALAALLEALRRAAVGLPYVSSRLNPGTRSKSSDLLPALSPRETLILRNIAAGRPVRTIAENLGISTKTVERHKENIKIKLNLRSASEILREAVRVFPAEFDD